MGSRWTGGGKISERLSMQIDNEVGAREGGYVEVLRVVKKTEENGHVRAGEGGYRLFGPFGKAGF
jgi:hypothetical protein